MQTDTAAGTAAHSQSHRINAAWLSKAPPPVFEKSTKTLGTMAKDLCRGICSTSRGPATSSACAAVLLQILRLWLTVEKKHDSCAALLDGSAAGSRYHSRNADHPYCCSPCHPHAIPGTGRVAGLVSRRPVNPADRWGSVNWMCCRWRSRVFEVSRRPQ